MANSLLNDGIVQQVREVFTNLKDPVQILFFGRKNDCEYCPDALQLIEEVAAISDKLNVQVYDLDEHAELASRYQMDKAPGLLIVGGQGEEIVDYGIRYAGIPSGHEFSSLIHDLLLVSGGDSGLEAETRTYLKDLQQPVHLQVFVTPTCPYCPQAVVLAHRMALESPMVQAEMVEAMEFPELSEQYGVSGVPHTTINYGAGNVIGAVPENHLLQEIQRALKN